MDDSVLAKYEVTVGIECHVQLATESKLFSGADNDEREKTPNSAVSPIDYALPGMLPVLNRRAVELAVIAARALGSKVNHVSRFDRKHYFYPDLPKGYQITQMYQPTIGPGLVHVPMDDGDDFDVRINHAHLEEDAGKLTHHGHHSLVDLNRAGTPLIEIVSEPDIHSPAQAKAYVYELYKLMTYAGVTRGDLYHGNMRFDVNVSVALKGSRELGTRAEMKNLNSFRSVERAVLFEFRRQVEIVERDDKVIQETRGWDEARQKTFTQRSKENAQDYRYMPDPDIPPIILDDEEINSIQSEAPKSPPEYRFEWSEKGFDKKVIDALLLSKASAELIDRILNKSSASIAKRVGFWFLKAIDEDAQEDSTVMNNTQPIPDESFIKLSQMVEAGKLNSNAGDAVFIELLKTAEDPEIIAKRLNLIQESDENVLTEIIDEVLSDSAFSKAVNDLQNGNEKILGFLVGQVMRKSGGKANPSVVQEIIKRKVK